MSASSAISNGQSQTILSTIAQHPYIFIAFVIVTSCVFTRIKTGSEARYNVVGEAHDVPRRVPVVPYWIPFVGHTVQFGVWFIDYLKSTAYSVPSGIFALKVAGGTHNIVLSPSLTRELIHRPNLPINNDAIIWRFLGLVFGDNGYFKDWSDNDFTSFDGVAKIFHGLMKEPFLTDGIARTVGAAEERTWNLLSGTSSWVDHSSWERAGKVEIVSRGPGAGEFVAEADLFGLMRHFVGDIASELLFGHCFMENNPKILDDLWLFDSQVNMLMLGLPRFITPGTGPAVAARERLIAAIIEQHRAMMDSLEGIEPRNSRYHDLSDISSITWDRVRGFHGVSAPPRGYGSGDLVLMWAMNVNANQTVFWMLFFIYSHLDVLASIRAEIAPYARLVQPDVVDGLPIQPAPRLKIDIESLMTQCPLLKGAFLETMRMEGAASTFRIATDDFVISESRDDALRVGKPHPEKYLIKKGDIINIPYGVHQYNPIYYPNPTVFDPRRFWTEKKKTSDEKGEETSVSVEYGHMRPWGGGKTMCKGRNFAEREVLSLVAAVLCIWDMEPVDKKNGWKHPGNVVTAGTFVPKKDVRVRMWRRREKA